MKVRAIVRGKRRVTDSVGNEEVGERGRACGMGEVKVIVMWRNVRGMRRD